MKNFKRASALLLTLALVLGMLPAMVFATEGSTPAPVTPATAPVAGDKVLFADFGASKDVAWQDVLASKLSDGSKIVATWDSLYLYLVYATKGGAAVAVNGQTATVTAGDTYDVAKIALAQLGIAPKNYKSYYNLTLTMADATWEGFIYLRNDESMVVKTGWSTAANSGQLNYAHNWVATEDALGSSMRVNYQAYLADGTNKFYAGSANGYVVDFDLDLTTLPVVSMDDATLAATQYRPLTTGMTFAMYDLFTNANSVDAEGNAVEDAINRNQVFFNIVKNDTGLKLLTRGSDNKYLVTDLDDDLGTQIHVRAEAYYTAGVMKRGITLRIYINDKFVLLTPDARMTNTSLGTTPGANGLGMMVMVNNFDTIADQSHAKNNIQAADVTISNVKYSEVNGAAHKITAGDGMNVLFADMGDTAKEAWENGIASKMPNGNKIVASWDSVNLTLVYATQNGAAVKINGKSAIVTAGDVYDVAKISLSRLGIVPANYTAQYPLSVVVGSVAWDGIVALRNDNAFVTKNAYAPTANSGFPNGSLATPYNWVATDTALGSGQRINYQANVNGTNKFYSVSTNGYVVDFDLDLTTMPVLNMDDATLATTGYRPLTTGVTIAMVDPFTNAASVDANGNVLEGAVNRNHIFYTIAKNASGWKLLTPAANTRNVVTDLGTDLGTQIHVRTETIYDNATKGNVTLKVYINGKLVLTSTTARYTNGALGTTPGANTLGLLAMVNNFDPIEDQSHAKNNIQAANVTISGVVISEINDAAYEQSVSAGNNVLVALRDGDAISAFNGGAWAGHSALLSDGTSKLFASWNADNLTLVYPTQNGAAATINGKAMSVIPGAAYDIAVISMDVLGLKTLASGVEFLASFAVNGKTWDGFLSLDELAGSTANTTSSWTSVYNWNITDEEGNAQWLNGNENEFGLDKTVVYDLSLAITSLPTQDPTGVKYLKNTGAYANGFSFTMYDQYTSSSDNLPDAATAQWWTPVVFAKDASGKLYVAVLEDTAVKYEYINGVILDGTTTYDLDVRVEYSHASATSNVVVLKVYVNGALVITSDNARDNVKLGSTPGKGKYGAKAAYYAKTGTLNMSVEAKQYIKTSTALVSKNVVNAEYSITTPNDTKMWNGVAGNVPFVTLWDHDNLYFLLEGESTVNSITLDGQKLSLTNSVLTAAGNTLIAVEKAFTDAVYGQTHKLSVVSETGAWYGSIRIVPTQPHTEALAGQGITNLAMSRSAQLDAESNSSMVLVVAGNRDTGEGAVVKFDNPGGIYFYDKGIAADGVATGDGYNNTNAAVYIHRKVAALSSVADKVMTVNVAIEELAAIESLTTKEWYNTSTPAMLNFVIGDADTATKAGLYFGLYNLNGVLTLGVNTTAKGIVAFPIGVMENYTNLNLRVEFSDPNPSSASASDYSKMDATFYVNGYYVGTVENAKKIGCGNSFSAGCVMYRAVSSTAGQRVAVTVSDVCIDTEVNTIMPGVHTHDLSNVVVVEPTCRYDGSSTVSCECGEAIVTVLPATGAHNFVYEWDENYHWLECEVCDLEKDGVRHEHVDTDSDCEDGIICDDCGYEILSAGDHDFGEFEVITEATCTTDGLKRAKCSRCDTWKDEIIPATGHAHGEGVVTTEATCGKDGVMTFTCACGDSYTEVIPATGKHVYNDGVVTLAPTCTVDGVMTFTCECGDSYTEVIPATGEHAYEEIIEHATCTEDGMKTFICGDCGDRYNEVIPATGHDYKDGVCGNCGEAEPVPEITNGLIFKDGTYYYLKNGVVQTGVVEVKITNGLDFATGYYRFEGPNGAISNGKFNINGIDRIYVNGVMFKDGMVAITNAEGKTEIYFLNVNGIIQKGAQQVVNAIEGFDENGWYMFHPTTGILCHGVVEIDGFNFMYINGVKQKRTMVELDGKIYATNIHGVICQNGAIEVVKPVAGYAAGWYRFDENGVICNGMFVIDGFTYYYKDGVKVKDTMFVYTDGKIYGTNRNGVVVSAAYELKYAMDDERLSFFEAGWYKFNSDGTLTEGFQIINGDEYYYRNGRKIMWQMFEVDGKYYYARRDGVVCKGGAFDVVNPLPGFEAGYYMLDADGSFFNGVHANGKTYVNGRAV